MQEAFELYQNSTGEIVERIQSTCICHLSCSKEFQQFSMINQLSSYEGAYCMNSTQRTTFNDNQILILKRNRIEGACMVYRYNGILWRIILILLTLLYKGETFEKPTKIGIINNLQDFMILLASF